MKSLMLGERVEEEVIGVWCDVLNRQEKLRVSASPLRLFLANRTYVRFILSMRYQVHRLKHRFLIYLISYLILFPWQIDPHSFDFEGLSLVMILSCCLPTVIHFIRYSNKLLNLMVFLQYRYTSLWLPWHHSYLFLNFGQLLLKLFVLWKMYTMHLFSRIWYVLFHVMPPKELYFCWLRYVLIFG